nr:MAG: hypothetical protein 1 [Leviviridae sp.]
MVQSTGFIDFYVSIGRYSSTLVGSRASDGAPVQIQQRGDIECKGERLPTGYYTMSNSLDEIRSMIPALKAWIEDVAISLTTESRTYVTSEESERMQDTVTPEFAKRSKAGEVIISPLDHSKTEATIFSTPGTGDTLQLVEDPIIDTWDSTSVYGYGARVTFTLKSNSSMPCGVSPDEYTRITGLADQLAVSDLGDLAMHRAFSNRNETDMDLAVTLAEMPQTVGYIRSRVKEAERLFLYLRSGRYRKLAPKAVKRAKAYKRKYGHSMPKSKLLAEIWLEMRYAIRPLVYDITSAMKYLENQHTAKHTRHTARGFEEADDTSDVSYSWNEDGVAYSFSGVASIRKEWRAGILSDVVFGQHNMRNLGLHKIGTMVWELIPWSFVLSWFISVDRLLAELDPDVHLTPLGSWLTTRTEKTVYGVVVATLPDGSEKTLPFDWSQTQTDRVPNYESSYITTRLNLDVWKLTDLAALARALRQK